MAENWHYTRNENQFGPVSVGELKQLVSNGKLLPTDLVWKDGMANWVEAKNIKGLFSNQTSNLTPSFSSDPPPIGSTGDRREDPTQGQYKKQGRGDTNQQSGGGYAVPSLVLGIIGLLAWCIPLFGVPINLVGLILGIKGIKSKNNGMAIAGLVLSGIGLALSILNAAWGAYLAATGQHPFLQ